MGTHVVYYTGFTSAFPGVASLLCGITGKGLNTSTEVPNYAPDKSCRTVSAEEDRRIRRERMPEPPGFLESELSLAV